MKYTVKPISAILFLLVLAVVQVWAQDQANAERDFVSKKKVSTEQGAAGVVITAPTISRTAGSTFDAVFQISDVNGQGIISYQGTLNYNNSILQFNSCSLAGTIGSTGGILCNITGPGQIGFVYNHTVPLVNDGDGPPSDLFKVSFTAIGLNGQASTLTIPDMQVMEFTVPAVVTPGSVTIGGSTAADVAIGGRVVSASGRPVSGARISMVDGQGVNRYSISNAFGYYLFQDVPSSATYTLTVASKRYTFAPRTVSVLDELFELDFVADQ